MGLNNLGLGFSFIGKDLVSPVMGGIRRQFGLTEGASKKLGKTIGAGFVALTTGALTTAVALGALGGAINLANQAGEFEQQMAAVGAITRATAKDMNTLETAAINAGIATQFSPKEAAEGLRNLGQMGFNATQAAKALVPALDFAAGGQISVAQASQTAASALRVFSLETDDAALTVDKLLRISNVTALKAADLELAMGNLGRGVGLTKQSIDEMLPSLGLVRNTGVEASTAATSVSSALLFMSKNSKKFKKDLGVSVTDAAGNFRPFMEVVLDTSKALGDKYVDSAERAAKAQELFGRFGVSSYTAISEQLTKGIRTTTGETLKGAAAMNYLREQMKNAAGAAAEFREKLLETFEGQKTLLRGTLETMAVVFGKPFAAVFKPFVGALTDSLNTVIRFFVSLPKPVQKAIAGIAFAIGVLIAALGIMLTIGGAITLLLPFMGTFIMVMKAMAIAIGTVVVVAAAFAAAIALAVWLIKNDIGGLGTLFWKTIDKIKLFWRGLVDLFQKGGFSEEVSKEMGRAENRGIRKFAINIFRIFYRIKRLFEGIAVGFRDAMKFFDPVFGALGEAFRRLSDVLGELGFDLLGVSGTPSDKFHEAGLMIGTILGGIVAAIAWVITSLVELGAWLIKTGSWLGDTFARYVLFVDEKTRAFIDTLKEVWEWLKKIGSSAVSKVISFFTGEEAPKGTQSVGAVTRRVTATPVRKLTPAGPPSPVAGMSAKEVAEQFRTSILSTSASDEAIRELSRTLEKRPTVVHVNMDGTRVGEAIASARRGDLARRGVPVGEEAI